MEGVEGRGKDSRVGRHCTPALSLCEQLPAGDDGQSVRLTSDPEH